MKRLLLMLLALAMVFALGACGSREVTDADPGNQSGADAEQDSAVAVEETVVLDKAGVKVTLLYMVEQGIHGGPDVYFRIENNSGREIGIRTVDATMNGYMLDPVFYETVEDGQSVQNAMKFDDLEMGWAGVETPAVFEFGFNVWDESTDEDLVEYEPVVIKTSAADGFVQKDLTDGTVAYDQSGVRIIVRGVDMEGIVGDPGVLVYLENGSDRHLVCLAQDLMINGQSVDCVFAPNVLPGMKCAALIRLSKDELDALGITAIERMQVRFEMHEMDTYEDLGASELLDLEF